MRSVRAATAKTLAAVLCLSVVIWSMVPTLTHTPKVMQTISDHLEMIADHGHSHGFEEDLAWALHGHSHEVGDHDHSQVILTGPGDTGTRLGHREGWRAHAAIPAARRIFRIERPPRA